MASATKAESVSRAEVGAERARALVRGVEHDACHADGGRGSDGVERRHRIGEQHEDERCARDERTKRGESGARIAAREEADLDEIDAEGDAVRHGVSHARRLHRHIADGGADRAAPGNGRDDRHAGVAVDGAKSALRRILDVDDVSAG